MSILPLPRWLARWLPRRAQNAPPARPSFNLERLRAQHEQRLAQRGLTNLDILTRSPAPITATPPVPTRTATRPAKPPRRRVCLHCKTKLTGRMRYYCSETCGKAYRRKKGAPSQKRSSASR